MTATGAPAPGSATPASPGHYPVEVPLTLRKHVLEDNAMPPRRRDRAAGARRHHRLMGETYSGAGVDIAAGEAAVDRIKGVVRSTYRPEVLGDIGGFGGLVTLPEGYRQPVLVSSTDGVGTKAMVATAAGRFDTIGIDLVAMCVDDIVCQGAEPLFFLDYISVGALDPDQVEALVSGVAEGAARPGAPWSAARWPSTPGPWRPASSTSWASWWGWPSATDPDGADAPRPATCWSACRRPACGRTATRWPAGSSSRRAGARSTTSCSARRPRSPTSCSGRR